MSENLDDYNFRAIRKCLDTAFDDVELDSFFLDFYYEKVYLKLSRGMRKDEKINLLMAHCRKPNESIEKLLFLIEKVQPGALQSFKIISFQKKKEKKISPEYILELEKLYYNSKAFLREVDTVLDAFANYKLDPSLKLISDAGSNWQQNIKIYLLALNNEFVYVNINQLHGFRNKMSEVHIIVQKIMGYVEHKDFLYLHQWFLDLKYILWCLSNVSGHHLEETTQALTPN